MIQQIQSAIRKAGLKQLPDDPHASLEELGLDSLMIVLIVSELEREFKIKIPALKIDREMMKTSRSIETFLKGMGVQS